MIWWTQFRNGTCCCCSSSSVPDSLEWLICALVWCCCRRWNSTKRCFMLLNNRRVFYYSVNELYSNWGTVGILPKLFLKSWLHINVLWQYDFATTWTWYSNRRQFITILHPSLNRWLCALAYDHEPLGRNALWWKFTLTIFGLDIKGKGKGLDTWYRAAYMSQTRDQQRFTISEVTADWHEAMVPQRIMWPSIARANGQLDPRCN